jgi:hypothetical protein
MLNPFLSSQQQEVIVFPLWQSLQYWKRFVLGFAGILLGFFIQYQGLRYLPWLVVGGVLILGGNLLLTVRGYDNRIKFGKYSPASGWEQVDSAKIDEVKQLVKKIKRWDRSLIDISNGLGKFTLIVWLIIFGGLASLGYTDRKIAFLVIAVDAFLLFFPHWVTGRRSIQTQPNLLLKSTLIKRLLKHRDIAGRVQHHEVEYFMLLKGIDEQKVPEDVKLRVKIHNQRPDFLGFYGQIVINRVGDKKYPYFYVVLVAKKGYGLKTVFTSYQPPSKIIKEFKVQEDVEVLVIRQKTTRTSGYHTKDRTIRRIFLEGLNMAEIAAVK